MMISEKFEEAYKKLCRSYGKYQIFYDFVKMCAITINNEYDFNQQFEDEYVQTINKYSKQNQALFCTMFAELILVFMDAYMRKDIRDFLGPIYENENLLSGQLGQFFTPPHISYMMASVLNGNINKFIEEDGFVPLNEPTCGSGGMVLSYAKVLMEQNINYRDTLLVRASDISDICVYMSYIQFALYDIPAVVFCR